MMMCFLKPNFLADLSDHPILPPAATAYAFSEDAPFIISCGLIQI